MFPENHGSADILVQCHEREAHYLDQHQLLKIGLLSFLVYQKRKLGWIEAKGLDYKVTGYKRGLYRLIQTIEHVKAEYKDHNRKHDLGVLLIEAKALQQYVNRHL